MKLHLLSVIAAIFIYSASALAQNPVMSTSAADRIEGVQVRSDLIEASHFANYPIENIGPTVMSGRVTDVAVNPDEPTEFFVAYASGGLWYTNNNGTSFTPKFDHESVMTIGDIDVHWETGTIYLGSGEVNSSRSSYAGDGLYRSDDFGESWQNIGLPESHHIGRIIVDGEDPMKVWVAALGHLYSPNPERGIYYTEDGGETWQHTLYVNENSGAVDLVRDQRQPFVFYAAVWERERRAWDFKEAGSGSGIYKSRDYGKTWTRISTDKSNFPTGENIGRIGLDLSYADNKTILYAILDNYNRRPPEEKEEEDGLTKDDFREMTAAAFADLEEEDLKKFLSDNGFPDKYSVKKVKEMVANGAITPKALKDYLEDANSLLFDTDVIGAEVYVSDNEGNSFKKTHKGYIDRLYNTYGYYFGQIRSEPDNPDVVYIMGVPILRSDDGGATWKSINGDNVHVDHHALWINPANPRHIVNGNDGGINISYDKGENWIKCNTPSVGQFYYINVDNDKPYNVYAGAQDNGVWTGSNNYRDGVSWHNSGHYPYESLLGGDGMQIQIDSRDNLTVYTGFQFGNYFRIHKKTGKRDYITPKHELGDRPYRWNWQTPILLSSHNQDILYMGANKLLRSMDKGENFVEISPDLTNGGKKGDVAYGTIVTIDESKKHFGKLLVGTDDGRLHLSMDGGHEWSCLDGDLPPHLWVSRALISDHNDEVLYVSLNGYRWDDFAPYLYRSDDNGASWESISNNLPFEPINVVKEDPEHANILYVGTDQGLYISTNRGSTFQRLANDLPNVAVHDVVVQEREGHLLVGTHGRSIYKLDLNTLRASLEIDQNKIFVFEIDDVWHRKDWGKKYTAYNDAVNPKFTYMAFSPTMQTGNIRVSTKDGLKLYEKPVELKKGVAPYVYDLIVDAGLKKDFEKAVNKDKKKEDQIEIKTADDGRVYLPPGEYVLRLEVGGESAETPLKIKERK